ncbi:excinuclease ABC subunit UvrC [Pseudothauera rhizosphaerae]|uniref:UvrABC system protein C n=1 Tax=Pseudothauera rhizosphaerae TaxID=2565932 RepID=A0A4S4AR30_9RHOO|nr:excinuclease ABC subunit UvrC [Pseudothauera rhizosphaerae]THF60896.1 excinuclease ABC subunit UvrC [Pseudothauera rhizosphaerae]
MTTPPAPAFDARAFLKTVPEEPGVYRMIGAEERVLYVGKAKNLKRRVSSYFQKTLSSPRIAMMVAQVQRVDVTPTRSEAEALLLENNLIKSLAPRYNILFRDDKSYPYIELSGDEFPRLAYHRGAFAKGARYFGPFPNAWAVRESIHLLQKTFQLRTCENSVFQNRSRPCLLHQIKRCTAPCVGLIDADAYAADVRLAARFLDGRASEVIDDLSARMNAAAERLAFEEAAACRDQVRVLQAVLHRQFVDSRKDEDVDIVAAVEEQGIACVNIAMVRGGRHLGDRPQFPGNAAGCSADDALAAFIEQHYAVHPMPARLLVETPSAALREILAELSDAPCALAAPRFAAEKAWLEMAHKNAGLAIQARARDTGRAEQRLEALREALDLPDPPRRIECFDISHTMGEATVASCVVCVDGQMKNAEYRRYNIAGITGGDDFAAMRQALERRYGKVAAGEGLCPDLILIDGGRGQVSAARAILAEVGLESVAMVGVAKGEGRKPGLESLVFPDGREPLHLEPDAPALHLIQEIRDEAHRFAITGHRARRAKARIGSKLEDIPGVGPSRRRNLLATFGGLDGVRKATVEDLCRVEGISRKLAEQIYSALH